VIYCLITREVKPGYEAEFETALRRFFSEVADDPHTGGAELVKPLNVEGSRTFGILRSFPDEASRDAFYTSKPYLLWSEHVRDFVEGEAQSRELHGLEAFFRDEPEQAPPPTWKMAAVTWVGVNVVTTPFVMFLMPLFVEQLGLPFPWNNFVFNIFVVATLSWVVMPLLVKWCSPWLQPNP